MTPDEQTTLMDALLDGEISEADFLRLEAELTVDPAVRKAYYERLEMELLLEQVASEAASGQWSADEETPSSLPSAPSRGLLLTGILIAVAASVLALVNNQWLAGKNQTEPLAAGSPNNAELEKSEPSATGFAILGGQSDAVWDGPAIRPGDLLPEGDLHLVSGLVHLELFSGVQMVVQGDALFSIDSPMQVTMQKGRARAHVPEPAHGFRLKTQAGDVIDLGTEFTVDVDGDRSAVKVVEGEVELRPKDAETRRLRDGEGLQVTSSDSSAANLTREIDLVGPTAFQDVLALRQSAQFRVWQSAADELRQDPRLIAHYLVDPDVGWSRRLVNRASADHRGDDQAIAGDGAVVAAERTRDRWGRADGALDFSRTGSRVRVVVPGEHRGLTLMCWVKINSLDRWYNSLFLTDGHEQREPHWQIMDDGRMFFSVKPPNQSELTREQLDRQVYYSDPFWNPSMSGQWIMLSTVYDVDQQQVTHYVNGSPITTSTIPDELLVESIKVGSASICNWSEPMYRTDATFVVRNLNGCVDEFAMFSGALAADEIANLFEAGNPHIQ